MFDEILEELKELVYELGEELEDENYDEALASIDIITSICRKCEVEIRKSNS